MNRMLTRFLGAALLICTASVASATQYPPGPGGAFPDTLTIINLQNSAAVPFPAVLDTVNGVEGIITGFDRKSTGYAFYMQDATGNPFTGIDVFTGSFNKDAAPFNLEIGDRVRAYGRKQEFQGETELEGYDGVQGTDDIIVRKISSGNPVPPFFNATTTQMKETPTNTVGEQYEGMLVKITSSTMKVARTVGLGVNSFMLVDSAAPSDSVFIDGNTLTTYAAPPLNTPVFIVQGIVNQRTRGYRIQLRSGNDIGVNTPPNLIDAYPVADNQIKVVFDRNVTSASATDVNNYSLASFGTVDGAVMSGNNAAILTVTNGLLHGQLETVTAIGGPTGVAASANNLPMTSSQSRSFVNGVLSSAEVEAANPDSLAPAFPNCFDKSRFAGAGGKFGGGVFGPRITVTGTAVGVYQALYYINDENQALRGGLSVFAPTAPLQPGRRYRLVGQIQEFAAETEMVGIVEITDLGVGNEILGLPVTVANAARDTCDASQTLTDGEDYECMLVKLGYVKVVQRFPTPVTNGFHVVGPNPTFGDTMFVSNLNSVMGSTAQYVAPPLGSIVSVTGILHYANSSFRVCPRGYFDVINHGTNVGVTPTIGKVRFAAVQNPSARPRLSFSLPAEAQVELGVYDVTGREIASLVKATLPAGEYTRAWDGRSATGAKLGAGVFFYRLKVNGETFNTKSIKLAQ